MHEFGEEYREITKTIKFIGEPHFPIVLLIDTSGSMGSAAKNTPIEDINSFLRNISAEEVYDDSARVDVAIIEFNDNARVVQEFTPLPMMQPVTLTAGGCTAMGAGIELAIDKVKERNRLYASLGTPWYQPWIFMVTDGMATDEICNACEMVKDMVLQRKLKLWAIGIDGCDENQLLQISERALRVNLGQIDLKETLEWLFELAMRNIFCARPEGVNFLDDLTDLPEGIKVLHREDEWI